MGMTKWAIIYAEEEIKKNHNLIEDYRWEGPITPLTKQGTYGIQNVGADRNDENDVIPPRFMRITPDEDVKIARERWQKTKLWRYNNKIDFILEEPQPLFFVFKQAYQHYYHTKSKNGHYMYVERPGQKNHSSTLWKTGMNMHQMARHLCFTTEYHWRVNHPDDNAKLINVFDLGGCTFGQLTGSTLQLFRMANELFGEHYPDRLYKSFVINSPWWFSKGWNLVKGWVDPRTAEKMVILGGKKEYMPKLLEYFDLCDIPSEFGGESKSPLGESEVELNLINHVKMINKRFDYPTSFAMGIERDCYNKIGDIHHGIEDKNNTVNWDIEQLGQYIKKKNIGIGEEEGQESEDFHSCKED